MFTSPRRWEEVKEHVSFVPFPLRPRGRSRIC
jgi:hypothetical protein